RAGVGKQATPAAGAAVHRVGRKVEALVDLAVAIVVDTVADLGHRRHRAVVLATVGRPSVQIHPSRIAGAHDAASGHAACGRVRVRAAQAAGAAVIGVVLLVEPFVDLAVAVVVHAVADLGPGEMAHVLAPVRQLTVDIPVVGLAGGDAAHPAHAIGDRVRDRARAAAAAVERIGLLIEWIVDHAVAVVVDVVAHFRAWAHVADALQEAAQALRGAGLAGAEAGVAARAIPCAAAAKREAGPTGVGGRP